MISKILARILASLLGADRGGLGPQVQHRVLLEAFAAFLEG